MRHGAESGSVRTAHQSKCLSNACCKQRRAGRYFCSSPSPIRWQRKPIVRRTSDTRWLRDPARRTGHGSSNGDDRRSPYSSTRVRAADSSATKAGSSRNRMQLLETRCDSIAQTRPSLAQVMGRGMRFVVPIIALTFIITIIPSTAAKLPPKVQSSIDGGKSGWVNRRYLQCD